VCQARRSASSRQSRSSARARCSRSASSFMTPPGNDNQHAARRIFLPGRVLIADFPTSPKRERGEEVPSLALRACIGPLLQARSASEGEEGPSLALRACIAPLRQLQRAGWLGPVPPAG